MGTTPPHIAASPPPNGGNYIIRGVTRRRHADSQLLMLQNPHCCWSEGRRTDRRAWLRCPWAAARPGRGADGRRDASNWTHGLRDSEIKLAQQEPHRASSGTKFAQHTKKRLLWAFFSRLGENIHAHGATTLRRTNFVTHRARQHKQLERKIAPTRGIAGHRETIFAHARPQEPFLAHFD